MATNTYRIFYKEQLIHVTHSSQLPRMHQRGAHERCILYLLQKAVTNRRDYVP